MIRAFVAISFPESVLLSCQLLVGYLKRLELNARFPRKEAIHLTLKFLGNIYEDQVFDIARGLEITVQELNSFALEVRGIGVFPSLAKPKVVWAGLRDCDVLVEMQRQIEGILEDLGFAREKRPFHPHLTLARLRSEKNIGALARYIEEAGPGERLGTAMVTQIHLFKSVLKSQGAEYHKLATAKLAR